MSYLSVVELNRSADEDIRTWKQAGAILRSFLPPTYCSEVQRHYQLTSETIQLGTMLSSNQHYEATMASLFAHQDYISVK
jgi:hypothetical protein